MGEKKIAMTVMVSPETRRQLQEVLLQKHGHVAREISRTIESIICEWISRERKIERDHPGCPADICSVPVQGVSDKGA